MASMDSGLGIVESATAVAEPVVTETTTTETPSTSGSDDLQVVTADTETPAEEATEGSKESETHKADVAAKGTTDKSGDPLPKDVTKALQAFKNANPENAKLAKELNGISQRYYALKPLLGETGVTGLRSVLSAMGAKNVSELGQTLVDQSSMIDTVKATDELLYSSSKKLWENVHADLVANGKEDQYGPNVANALDHLKSVDAEGYYAATKPHMVAGLNEAGLPSAINSIWDALTAGKPEDAKAILKQVGAWFSGLRDEVSETGRTKAEMSKLDAAKATWQETQDKAERGKVENGIAETCDSKNNVTLGKYLGTYLKMPFFKDFPYATKVDLGNKIKDDFYAALKADKQYQGQMSSMWKEKTPNREKMVAVHQTKLDEIAERIVRGAVQGRYPGYARGGSSAGKAAASVTKKADATKSASQSISTMRPIYIAVRPENLVRDSVTVGSKTYNSEQLQVLQISGKGFTRNSAGQLRFVTWRR